VSIDTGDRPAPDRKDKPAATPRLARPARAAPGDGPAASTSIRAVAGQELAFEAADVAPQIVAIDPATAASWQEGRLLFIREPLSSVIESVNRHCNRKLVLADPALGQYLYTGTVFEAQIDDWLRGLPAIFPLRVENRQASTLILAARARK
jgi:ferric-dicitrate binding protein FerR (iron transport regulator)